MHRPHAPHPATADSDEIARFDALAETWWDESGPMAPLHRLNPTRIAFIRDAAVAHWRRDPRIVDPLKGLDLLDVGCGGGLITEPMARLGARVTGLDLAERNVAAAQAHAALMDLDIRYRATPVEELAAAGETFDIVLALEVVEHVADLDLFLAAAARCTRPGGLLFVATLNRTAKSFATAIVGAEYVLGWVPRGTHQWRRFVRPAEIVGRLQRDGLFTEDMAGMTYAPLSGDWQLSRDVSVNYILCAARPPA
ncbi:MAG: bifunctional 3-demethylubiquinol 3-O-methyltransferase/2-polyprenyl-6-hydroxyphenol methylase [Rhodospirillaceae bacterium]|nr:bifunctional 3-demethylubiquinol 3-O-methyltransferase/2-polyprenyl-6-hydroxyphenol methylase [Rhodospirillaceae bacterium]